MIIVPFSSLFLSVHKFYRGANLQHSKNTLRTADTHKSVVCARAAPVDIIFMAHRVSDVSKGYQTVLLSFSLRKHLNDRWSHTTTPTTTTMMTFWWTCPEKIRYSCVCPPMPIGYICLELNQNTYFINSEQTRKNEKKWATKCSWQTIVESYHFADRKNVK